MLLGSGLAAQLGLAVLAASPLGLKARRAGMVRLQDLIGGICVLNSAAAFRERGTPMSRRYGQWLLHALAVFTLMPVAAGAQTTIGTPVAFPTTVPVAVGTPVRVTAAITGSVIAASVVLQRIDAAGRVVGTVGPLVDDGSNGDLVAGDRMFTARPTLYEPAAGAVRLRVAAAFQGRLALVLSAPVTVTVTGASATVTVTQPANLSFLNVSPTQVRGTVGDPQATVVINGVPAVVTAGTFSAQVPLLEGTNTLTAVATNSNQRDDDGERAGDAGYDAAAGAHRHADGGAGDQRGDGECGRAGQRHRGRDGECAGGHGHGQWPAGAGREPEFSGGECAAGAGAEHGAGGGDGPLGQQRDDAGAGDAGAGDRRGDRGWSRATTRRGRRARWCPSRWWCRSPMR